MPAPEHLLNTSAFRQAIASIRRRAEKQTDWTKIGDVFVKTDLFDRVQSRDSQLLLGRRGTGKTHLLRAFQQDTIAHGDLAVYIDCTRLGSGYSGLELAPATIAEKYFIALLNQLGTDLLDETIRLELPSVKTQESLLTKLLAEKDAADTLAYLVNNVLKGYKSRTFLVESTKAENPKLIRLLNERVVHRLNGTYSHQDRPGVRYDLFTVDYGAFARFRSTVNAVSEDVFVHTLAEASGEEDRKQMVPVDDKRSIRRIVFDPDKMEIDGYQQLQLPGM